MVIQEVTIYNPIGQRVKQGIKENNAKLRPGMYVVDVKIKQWVVMEKLVVK